MRKQEKKPISSKRNREVFQKENIAVAMVIKWFERLL